MKTQPLSSEMFVRINHMITSPILISEKGVYVGSMKSLNLEKNSSNEFEEYRFIPRDQIDKIMVCKNLKNPLDIDF